MKGYFRNLAATEKASLTTALDDARNDPAKLQGVLQQVRQALEI